MDRSYYNRVVIGGHTLPEAWLVSQMVGGSMEASFGALPLCICGFRPRSSFPAPVLVMGIRYYSHPSPPGRRSMVESNVTVIIQSVKLLSGYDANACR